jgi:hypothetical protein
MAIINCFECTISVNGSVAKEYDAPEEEKDRMDANVVTKYIEAVCGANFSVEFKIKPQYEFDSDYLAAIIKLDGERRGRISIKPSSFSRDHGAANRCDGIRVNNGDAWVFRKYKFGNLEISEI